VPGLRLLAAVAYVAGALAWTGVSWISGGLRCDDACVGRAYSTSWTDQPDAWQYGVILPLALAGLGLCVVAVAAWRRPRLAAAVVGLHLLLFAANLFVILHGASGGYGGDAWLVPAGLAAPLLYAASGLLQNGFGRPLASGRA
jgi:hypothetical protein